MGSILIHAGKITAIGPTVVVPAGAQVLDANGMIVYPGFINGYTTDGLKIPDAPANGTAPESRTTAPAGMFHENRKGVRADVVAAKCLSLKSEISSNYAQGVTTALISSGSGSIRGNAAVVDYTSAGAVLVPNAGTELSFRGGGGGGGAGYPGTLFGVIANLRQWLADAQYYAGQSKPKPDSSLDNLKPLVTGQVSALFNVDSPRDISRAARISDEFNLKMEVLGGREAYRAIDVLKRKSAAVIVDVDPGTEPSLKPDTGPGASPPEVLEERHATWVEHTENAKKLDAAGIPYAFCAGMTGLSDYLKNVRRVIGTGLPRDAALRALTSGAAHLLGVDDRVGTIEVGKLANLVIMTGDFADAKSEVQSVVVEGVVTVVKKPAPPVPGAKK